MTEKIEIEKGKTKIWAKVGGTKENPELQIWVNDQFAAYFWISKTQQGNEYVSGTIHTNNIVSIHSVNTEKF